MIQVKNISKCYGDHFAIQNISFDIEAGKIYGLLGPNGAGKSTTMNIMTGSISATDGSVTVDGNDMLRDPIAAKRKIGYLPEIPPLYPEMTPYEYLTFIAEAKGVPQAQSILQIKEVLSLTGTDVVADRLIKNLSKGYKQRVGIAQALIGNPQIVILDEPTVGLDPKQLIEVRNLIKKLGETKTVIVSSHILSEISAVCDHIMIISHGKLVANDTIQALEASAGKENKLFITAKGDAASVQTLLDNIEAVTDITPESVSNPCVCRFSMRFSEDNDPRETIFGEFSERKIPLIEISTDRVTLEDIFLQLTFDEFEEIEEDSGTSVHENYTPQFSTTADNEEEDI